MNVPQDQRCTEASWMKIVFITSNRQQFGAKIAGTIPSLPHTSQKTAIPATLLTNLRIDKTLLTPRRYGDAEAEVEVFDPALIRLSDPFSR